MIKLKCLLALMHFALIDISGSCSLTQDDYCSIPRKQAMAVFPVYSCAYSSAHLKADLYFVFNSLLQNEGLLLKAFQVSC